jgi:PAS domain S-box-containing protein
MVYKAPYLNANREIAGVVVSLLDISERTEAEGNIRAARDFYLTLFEHFPALIWRAGTDARYNYFNQTWLEFTGRPLEQEGGEGWTEGVHAEDLDRCRKTFMTAFRQRHPFTMEYRLRRHDGQYRWLQDMGRPFHDLDGSFAGYIGTCFDITETKGLQQQVIQAQRMEAIGTLTGGIAHDFNNIMTVVQGHANLLQMRVGQDERLLKSVDQILAASERAVALTQSLLLYSRRQVSSPACVNLNNIIREMQELVRGVLQEDISLRFNLDETPMTIMADARQMEQVLMNLLVNARDALPAGGNITISTSLAHLDEEKTGRLQGGVPPGDYCLLTVSDNGKGMDEETRKRIFEPFFTTKEVGKGTGLGLSVVYGIVTQHNGLLDCASRQGAGTDFQVYLPLTAASVSETPVAATASGTTARGEETILLAEDEPMLRQYAREMLEEFGYTVIEAVDGEDALKQFQCQAERIDLLLLDVIMPKINGKSVFEKACLLRPDIKAIFTSGYTAEILGEKNILGPDVNFLSKPVAPDILLQKIREVLDA